MPSIIKRKTSDVPESPFKVYTGDEPKPGGYRAILKFVNAVKSSGDNVMLKPVCELKAFPGSDRSKYDGYAVFPQIVLTDNESNMQREQSFYLAVCGKKDADLVCETDPGKFKPSDGQKTAVTKIGGVKPENIVVNVKLRMKAASGDFPAALECDLIFASRDENASAPSDDDDEESADDEEIADYTEDELMALGLPALRAILVDEFEMDAAEAKLLKQKVKLVAAILEAQANAEDDAEDDEDESDDEEEEEESDEEEDEEEDDEEDPEAALREEYGSLDRNALKAAIKKRKGDFKFLKSQTDEFLLDELVKLALTDPPF